MNILVTNDNESTVKENNIKSKLFCGKLTSKNLLKLPRYIGSLEFIEYVNIQNNKLGSESFDIISLNFNLRVLNISYNPIKEVPKTISRFEKLEKISLGGGPHIFIADVVYELNLTTLQLYNIKLCPKTLEDKKRA